MVGLPERIRRSSRYHYHRGWKRCASKLTKAVPGVATPFASLCLLLCLPTRKEDDWGTDISGVPTLDRGLGVG